MFYIDIIAVVIARGGRFMNLGLPGFMWVVVFSIYMLTFCLWKNILNKNTVKCMLCVSLLGVLIYPFIFL